MKRLLERVRAWWREWPCRTWGHCLQPTSNLRPVKGRRDYEMEFVCLRCSGAAMTRVRVDR